MVDAEASSRPLSEFPWWLPSRRSRAAFDAVVVTDLGAPQATFDAAAAMVGPDRVLAPKLLGVRARPRQEATHDVSLVCRANPAACGKQGDGASRSARALQPTCRAISSAAAMRAKSRRWRRRCSRATCSSPSTWRRSAGVPSIRPSACRASSATATSPRRCLPRWWRRCKAGKTPAGFVKLERRPRFAPGEQVRIVDGVFAELSRSVRRHGRSGARCDPARPAGTQGQDPAGRRRHHGGLTRRHGRAAGQKRLGEPRFTRTAVAYGLRTGCR